MKNTLLQKGKAILFKTFRNTWYITYPPKKIGREFKKRKDAVDFLNSL